MKSQLVTTLLSKIITASISFLILILTSRVLGVEARGHIAYYFMITAASVNFLSISVDKSYIALSKDNTRLLSLDRFNIYSNFIALQGSFLLLLIGRFILNLSYYECILVSFSTGFGILLQSVLGPCIVLGKLNRYNITFAIGKIIFLLLVCLSFLISVNSNYQMVLLAYVLSTIVTLTILRTNKKTSLKSRSDVELNFSSFLVYSLKIHSSTFGTVLSRQVPFIIIGYYYPKSLLALVDGGLQLVNVAMLLISSLTPIVFSVLIHDTDSKESNVTKILLGTYLSGTIFFLLLHFFSDQIILTILGKDFSDVKLYLDIIIVMSWFSMINFIAGPKWVINGDAIKLSVISLIVGIVNTVMTLYFSDGDVLHILYLMTIMSASLFFINLLYLYKR